MGNYKNCIKCGTIHLVEGDEYLPELCASCYRELYQSIPEYIPKEQHAMWLERKAKEWQ